MLTEITKGRLNDGNGERGRMGAVTAEPQKAAGGMRVTLAEDR